MARAPSPPLCRAAQTQLLYSLLDPAIPSPPAIVCYGPAATGKTLVASAVLPATGVPYAVVRSQSCITGRHLLETISASVRNALDAAGHGPFDRFDPRCESLAALAAQLQALLARCQRFYLVADGADRQREAPPTLLPALARLGEIIPGLTVLFLVHHAPPGMLRMAGAPHVGFAAYSRAETLELVGTEPLAFVPGDEPGGGEAWLWPRFCGLAWDALGKGAARDVVSFRELCGKVWPSFVAPVRAGELGPRELAKLVTRSKGLFQTEDKLVEGIVKAPATQGDERKRARGISSLSYYGKYLLIAAYLASHNPARLDSVFFMKMHDKKRRRRNRASAAQHAAGATLKHYKIQRRLLGPQGFAAERLMAVFAAILPAPAAQLSGADLLGQVASLAALRLLVRSGGAADACDGGARWRINVGWEFVKGVARGVRFEIEQFLEE